MSVYVNDNIGKFYLTTEASECEDCPFRELEFEEDYGNCYSVEFEKKTMICKNRHLCRHWDLEVNALKSLSKSRR